MNKAFSKIWILVVLIVLIAGVIFAWQYFGDTERERIKMEEKIPKEATPEKTLEKEVIGEKAIKEYISVCGNALCEIEESCKLCPKDCGNCPDDIPVTLPPFPIIKDASCFKTSEGGCIGKVRLTIVNLNYPSITITDALPENSMLVKFPGKPEIIGQKLKWVLKNLTTGSIRTLEYIVEFSELEDVEFPNVEFPPASLTYGEEEILTEGSIICGQCFGPELRITKINFPEKIEKDKEFMLTVYFENLGVEEAIDADAMLLYQVDLPILRESKRGFIKDALEVEEQIQRAGNIKPGETKIIGWKITPKYNACYTLPVIVGADNYYAFSSHMIRFCSQ